MSDKANGFIVTLEEDFRLDDLELLMQTIRFMRGISNVEANIVDPNDWINQQRIKSELRSKMIDFIKTNL